MSRRKVVKKSDGSKTVIQSGRIVGNLPSNKAVNPASGNRTTSPPTANGGNSAGGNMATADVYAARKKRGRPSHGGQFAED